MQEAEVRELVASERRELAGLLHGLSPAQWDAPSLCAGWRVREVVAHITMPFRYSLLQVAGGVVKDRGNVHRTSDRYARRDAAALTTPELLASLADNAERVWKPPGGGIQGALSHDVIHGLDITTALGADRAVPMDRLRLVLDGITPRRVAFFGVQLDGVELRADDMTWSYGAGTPVRGAAQDLLLVLCGRKLPAGRLHGRGSERFSQP